MPYDSAAETWHHIHQVRIAMTEFLKELTMSAEELPLPNDPWKLTLFDLVRIAVGAHNRDFDVKLEEQVVSLIHNTFVAYPEMSPGWFSFQMLDRMLAHDQSKLKSPEKEGFDEWTPRLRELTYGSKEYEAARKALGPTLEHHYAHNSHHPEHHVGGLSDMTILDVIEMLCDWRAATMRHNDGSLVKSFDVNRDRFGFGPLLLQIFWNTALQLDWITPEEYDYEDFRRRSTA